MKLSLNPILFINLFHFLSLKQWVEYGTECNAAQKLREEKRTKDLVIRTDPNLKIIENLHLNTILYSSFMVYSIVIKSLSNCFPIPFRTI